MNNWKKWLIIIFIIAVIGAGLKISLNKDYKSEETGNNKSIKEIEEYILNIKSYRAKIQATIKNNRNENSYIISQEVNENAEKQEVLDPEEIAGLTMTYQNRNFRDKKYEPKFKQNI